jgi:hypothetical protein
VGVTLLAATAMLVAVWAYGRLRQTTLWSDWQTIFSDRGRSVYMQASERFGNELSVIDFAFDCVDRHGEILEAVRIMGFAHDVLADTAPSLRKLLEGMGKLSRMVSAFAPMTPPDTASFRDVRLRRLAWWGNVLHIPLVSSAERFRLRTYMLALEVRTLSSYLLESRNRLEAEPKLDSPSWAEIEALVADYHTVTDETLASLRALLVSAERRPSA